jgi:hypothetical protein
VVGETGFDTARRAGADASANAGGNVRGDRDRNGFKIFLNEGIASCCIRGDWCPEAGWPPNDCSRPSLLLLIPPRRLGRNLVKALGLTNKNVRQKIGR